MLGKCAYAECAFGDDDDIGVVECSICKKEVHHVCSNALYEGELYVRACSPDCAEALLAQQGPRVSAEARGQRGPALSGSNRESHSDSSKDSSEQRQLTPGEGKASCAKKDDSASSNSESTRGEAAPKRKFYFTPAADLALLKEVDNIRPFAAEHGHKGERYKTMTNNLNEHLDAKLSVRTVKDHFVLLLSEFTATDCKYRKKSGVAEDYTEHKQLLQDISDQMKEVTAVKAARKGDKRAKTERLETQGELLREQARKRRCQRMSLASESGGDCASDSSVSPSETIAISAAPSTTASRIQPQTSAQVNAAISDYLVSQKERRKEEQLSVELGLQFKRAKAEEERNRWKADFELRKLQVESAASKWSEEVAIRREEMQLRREELALLRMQMDLPARPAKGSGNQNRSE